jgi:hypothetical protein
MTLPPHGLWSCRAGIRYHLAKAARGLASGGRRLGPDPRPSGQPLVARSLKKGPGFNPVLPTPMLALHHLLAGSRNFVRSVYFTARPAERLKK